MMRSVIKRTMLFVASSAVVALMIPACYLIFMCWMFRANVVNDVYIVQRPFSNVYDFKSGGETLIRDVNGWIINGNYVYGSCNECEYFLIHLPDHSIVRYKSLSGLDEFLLSNCMPIYDMSDEENESDLIYGAGRNRVYGPK